MLAHGSGHDLGVQAPGGVLACSERLLTPARVIELGARLRARVLDQRLATGADPRTSPWLAARAAQLTTPRSRARIAAGLERLAIGHEGPLRHFAVLPASAAITPNRERLLDLAAYLRSPRPAYAGGIARARLVLTDGTGPAYAARHGEALTRTLQLIDAQLRS